MNKNLTAKFTKPTFAILRPAQDMLRWVKNAKYAKMKPYNSFLCDLRVIPIIIWALRSLQLMDFDFITGQKIQIMNE
jgi:hypothetical protein